MANQTAVSTPFLTDLVANLPPMSVRTHPGETEFTLMPFDLNLFASFIVKAFRAVLEIPYAGARKFANIWECICPERLEMLIILPPFLINGAIAWETKRGPYKFTSSVFCKTSFSKSRTLLFSSK